MNRNSPETTIKTIWKVARFPLLGLVVLLSLYVAWVLFDLPPREETIAIITEYFARYGFWVVLIGSFLEALLLIGWYFPGSLIIFLAVILAPTPWDAVIAVVLVTIGLYSGYIVNFFLGKYGWYRLLLMFGIRESLQEAQEKLSKYGIRAIFLSYWNPGLASFTATAAGVLQYNFFRFLIFSLIAVSVWNIFWGTLVYSLGERALDTILTWPFIIFTIFVWIGVRYVDNLMSAKRNLKKQKNNFSS